MRGRFGEGVEWGRVWRRCSLDFRVGLMDCGDGDIDLKRIEFEDELEPCLVVPMTSAQKVSVIFSDFDSNYIA
jgi:hypothetical protein